MTDTMTPEWVSIWYRYGQRLRRVSPTMEGTVSREVDTDQLKRFYARLFELANDFSHPNADSPIEDILFNIADWIEFVDKPKESDPSIGEHLDAAVNYLDRASLEYYASFT